MTLLLVTIPALLGALGTVVSAYVALKVRTVQQQTDGQMTELRNEVAALKRQRRRRTARASRSIDV